MTLAPHETTTVGIASATAALLAAVVQVLDAPDHLHLPGQGPTGDEGAVRPPVAPGLHQALASGIERGRQFPTPGEPAGGDLIEQALPGGERIGLLVPHEGARPERQAGTGLPVEPGADRLVGVRFRQVLPAVHDVELRRQLRPHLPGEPDARQVVRRIVANDRAGVGAVVPGNP